MSEQVEGLVIQYNVTDAAIAEIAEQFKDTDASTPDGYKEAVAGIRCTRELRGEVETRRKELKADALTYGRRVDKEAKRITDSLWAIEHPLKLGKAGVDDAKAKAKREAEEKRVAAERKKLEEERAAKEAEERKARELEEARLAEERKALEAERAKLEEEKRLAEQQTRESNRIAQEKLDAENRERQARLDKEQQERNARLVEERKTREAEDAKRKEKERLEDEDRDRRQRELEKAEGERLAREEAEAKQKREADEAKEREVERLELEKRRQAALPDVEKLEHYAQCLIDVELPHVASPSGGAVLAQMRKKIVEAEAFATEFRQELES